ncbi:hypothetical protein DSM106972_073000 [Dulcicalothrix desertica PCC 7102]|uniref:Uncharacterized protein n=1 Tax=Dulcicalothrix desertica PCC 7102 TaxID=232991 RepID=A0A3S1CD93_9CYAN|nr:hypothetical protein DSM106972_073000 [Dulcicalothrix desertica PCC 7102]
MNARIMSVSETINQVKCQLINVVLVSIKTIEKYIFSKNISIADIEIPQDIALMHRKKPGFYKNPVSLN